MPFLDMVAELTGSLPGLSEPLAEIHINRAWREIRRARNWGWLVFDGVVVCPPQITTGSVAYTQYGTTAVFDAAASAALLAQANNTTQPGLTNLQVRFNPSDSTPFASQVYSILSVDVTNPAAIAIVTDRMIVESTDTAAGYQVYRAYIVPPLDDFKSWVAITDVTNGWTLNLNNTSAYFDRRDPQRQAQGLAYFCGFFEGNTTVNAVSGATSPNPNQNQGRPNYELWPHPTGGQNFYVRLRREGEAFSQPTDEPPSIIPEGLIVQRALGWHTYQWALANVAHYPTFKGVNFVQLINSARSYYMTELLATKRADDEQALQTVWNKGHGLRARRAGFKGMWDFPVDAAYIQSHLVNF